MQHETISAVEHDPSSRESVPLRPTLARRTVAVIAAAAAIPVLALSVGAAAGSPVDGRVDGIDAEYLVAYARAPEGAHRKVGSHWFEKTEDGWTASEAPSAPFVDD